jgi:hypothetical protein
MSKFTEADKVNVLATFNKIIEEDKDKYHAYHEIYHVLKDSCDCRVPDSKILPERADMLHFLQKKIHDHECHGLPSSWWKASPQQMQSPLPEAISITSLMTLKIIIIFFRVVAYQEQRCFLL